MVLQLFCRWELALSDTQLYKSSAAEPRKETRSPSYQSCGQYAQPYCYCRGTCRTSGSVSIFPPGFLDFFQSKLKPGGRFNLTVNAKSTCYKLGETRICGWLRVRLVAFGLQPCKVSFIAIFLDVVSDTSVLFFHY